MALVGANWRPDARSLRSFGFICLGAFLLMGTWAFFRKGLLFFDFLDPVARDVAFVFWGLSLICGLLAVSLPKLLYPVYWVLMLVALPIGFVVSHAIMVLVYYGLFAPVGLVFRLVGRDVLERRFERRMQSYWVKRPRGSETERYFRQY